MVLWIVSIVKRETLGDLQTDLGSWVVRPILVVPESGQGKEDHLSSRVWRVYLSEVSSDTSYVRPCNLSVDPRGRVDSVRGSYYKHLPRHYFSPSVRGLPEVDDGRCDTDTHVGLV